MSRYWRALLLAVVLLVVWLAVGAVSANGGIEVFKQNYSQIGSIPNNIQLMNSLSPYSINSTIAYSEGGGILGVWNTTNNKGELTIGGFVPATVTNYTILMDTNRTNANSYYYLYGSGMQIQIQKANLDKLYIYQFYQEENGTFKSQSFNIPSGSYAKPFELNIEFNGLNQTYTTRIGSNAVTTNLTGTKKYPYNRISGNLLRFVALSPYDNASIILYSVNQTLPKKSGNVTSVGDPKLFSIGFDGPHNKLYWQNGSALISSYNGKGTIWADVGYYNTSGNKALIQSYLDQGWELGIHLSTQLIPMNYTAAYALMDSEVATISSAFGQTPTSWCSLANADNETHAIYAYNTHGMIWRNGGMGIGELSNVGNLDNETYPSWWEIASRGGILTRTFTHETDIFPAIAYSIDPAKFAGILANYSANEITPTSYYDWYKIGANTNDSTFTENTLLAGEGLNFTAHTNGYPARVEVPYVYGSKTIRNVTGGSVEVATTQANDGNIAFYVSNGMTYEISDAVISQFTPTSPLSITYPNGIYFQDASTGSPTAWDWTWGDGTHCYTQNCYKVWYGPGTYNVSLNASTPTAYSKNYTTVSVRRW